MRMKWVTCFALLLFLLPVTGCGVGASKPYIRFNETEQLQQAKHSVEIEASQPLRIVVSSVLPYKDTIGFYRQIAEHLAIQIGRPTELIQRKSNVEASRLLENGGADIAFFSTGTFVSYAGTPELEALVMRERRGTPTYGAYIIVPKNSDAVSFASLRGKTFAFADTLSFSGYFYPNHLLRQAAMTPEQFFSKYLFTYSHMKSLRAVAERVVDGAAIDNSIYEYAKENLPELTDAVRVLDASPPIGTGPVVVRKSMSESQKELLRSIFLNMHRNRDMQQTLGALMIDRFVGANPEFYAYPRRIIQEMRSPL